MCSFVFFREAKMQHHLWNSIIRSEGSILRNLTINHYFIASHKVLLLPHAACQIPKCSFLRFIIGGITGKVTVSCDDQSQAFNLGEIMGGLAKVDALRAFDNLKWKKISETEWTYAVWMIFESILINLTLVSTYILLTWTLFLLSYCKPSLLNQ